MGILQEFLHAVLPSTGWFYVASIGNDKQCRHKGYLTADAEDAHQWTLGGWQQSKRNVYFTPCTWTQQYTTNDEGKNKNCRKQHDLVHRLRAFWLDIDSAKDGKTIQQSATELATFCKDIRLPLPNIVVKTGGGLHVYWTFEDELTLAQWQPVADALKAACIAKGFQVDHTCTADHARILRLPHTRNFKYPTAPDATVASLKPHTDYASFVNALMPFKGVAGGESINDEFSSSNVEYVKGRMALVAERCALIAAVAKDGGASCAEPLWKGILHVCAHAEDGQEWAHKLSSGHKDYTVLATDRKLRDCDTAIPPTRCSTLSTAYWEQPSPCASCEYNGKIKGPLMLGRERSEGAIKKPVGMPEGYYVSSTGVYHTFQKDGEEVVERVTQLPILKIEVHDIVENSTEDSIVVPHIQLTWLDGAHKQHKGMIPMHVLPDYRAAYSALSAIKFPFTRQDHKHGFDTLMTNWVQKLRETGEVTTGKPQFGWHFSGQDRVEGFAIGNTMYTPDGSTKRMLWPDSQLNHIYSAKGDLNEWKKAVALMQRRNNPELMALIAAAFAAPLFVFLGESSAVLSAVSQKSGVGKSSALKVAQAVWGDPKRGLSSLDDTPKSVAHKMGIIKHLPVFWDELRLTDDTAPDFLQMMFQLSQGRERTRLTVNADFREAGTWDTILVCASNNRLAEIAYTGGARSNANLKRLFEYDIKYDGETPRAVDGTEIFNNLRHNYGHAGIEYAKYLVQNVPAVHRDVLAMNRHLFDQTGAGNEDRFWIGTMACLLVGAAYAKRLGLVDFNVRSLKDFLVSTYMSMQTVEEEVIETDFSSRTLYDFIRHHGGTGISFRNTKPRRGVGEREELHIIQPPRNEREGLIWEYYAGSGLLRIHRAVLAGYLRSKHISKTEFFNELTARGFVCHEARTTMAQGTRFEMPGRQYVFDITIPESDRTILATAPQEEGGSIEDM